MREYGLRKGEGQGGKEGEKRLQIKRLQNNDLRCESQIIRSAISIPSESRYRRGRLPRGRTFGRVLPQDPRQEPWGGGTHRNLARATLSSTKGEPLPSGLPPLYHARDSISPDVYKLR